MSYDNTDSPKVTIYITPAQLYNEWLNSCKDGACTPRLLNYFERIAKEYSKVFEYTNYQDRRAIINYAVAEAWQKWDKYDPERTNNIFAFFTQMIKNDLMIHYNYLTKGKASNISIEALYASRET